MEKQAVFKTSFYGFEKEAVLKYIDEMGRAASQTETDLEKRIEEITKSREQLEEQIQGFEENLKNLEQELNQERGKNQKLGEMVENLQEEIDRQRKLIENREQEFRLQREENQALRTRVSTATHKSKKYDEASFAIGAAILEAQQSAKRIVDQANVKAEEIARDADQRIASIVEKINGMREDFLALRGRVNESVERLNTRFDEIAQEIEETRDKVQETFDQHPDQVTWEPKPEEPPVEEGEPARKKTPPGRLNLTEQELQKHRYF